MLFKRGPASIAFYLTIAMSLPALASPPMATGAAVVAPRGFIGFCLKYQLECRMPSSPPVAVELSEERYQQLEFAQTKINRLLRPRTNPDHVWDYPTDGYGDCNNYAIAKRAELIAVGWPRAALLLAAATTEDGEGHLVLVAVTSKGDLVLDNRQVHILEWRDLPYRWLSRQNPRNLAEWVSIVEAPPIVTADARSSRNADVAPNTPAGN
jgi:predicted transglutaminase-like cysteine proteinase